VEVHADASNFVSNVSKQEAYTQVLESARGLFYDQRNWVSLYFSTSVFFNLCYIRSYSIALYYAPCKKILNDLRFWYSHIDRCGWLIPSKSLAKMSLNDS